MRIELTVERSTPYHSEFSCVRNITIVPKSSIQENGTSTVSPARRASMLGAGRSITMFPCEN
jgi:hypothetical protein